MVNFHIIASTGRTATTSIAKFLNRFPSVLSLHEGHRQDEIGSRQATLPTINLENYGVYAGKREHLDSVLSKRAPKVIAKVLSGTNKTVLVDVAYYNSSLAETLLRLYDEMKMVCIIRDCEEFVRSSTVLAEEDKLPVGWPPESKPLTPREKFIGLGRLRPLEGTDFYSRWPTMSTVERNIWLWMETNLILLRCYEKFSERVVIFDFADIRDAGIEAMTSSIAARLGINTAFEVKTDFEQAGKAFRNKRGGEVILPGSAATWRESEKDFLSIANSAVAEMRLRLEA